MCGITGFIEFNSKTKDIELVIRKMTKSLYHRGPDNQGVYIKNIRDINVALGHTRLSIIDLSDAANQPMQYRNLQIVYNGEIYNFKEIKKELLDLGHEFHLNSDTEVILHAYFEWKDLCLNKFRGMFSFVIFDNENETLFMARDRAGVKPFYYYFENDIFLFGSELKSLLEHPSFCPKIDKDSLAYYFKFNNVPSPKTIYQKVHKLSPGHFGTLNLNNKNLIFKKYYDIFDLYSSKEEVDIGYEEAKKKTKKLLIESVKLRTISDVPVGVFLSGGIDSSTVTAIMKNCLDTKIKTFTIGFESGNNEAPYAKQIASFLKTEHFEHYMSVKDAKEIIHNLPFYYDEPFADSSSIPTTFVSQLASEQVKVVLSADGGDELFFGYDDYNNIDNYSSKFSRINNLPSSFKKVLSQITGGISKCYDPHSFKSRKYQGFSKLLKENKNIFDAQMFELYSSTSSNLFIDKLLNNNSQIQPIYTTELSNFKDKMSMFLALDYHFYLQNDMLTKIDRASMSTSIEGREPLMDHKLLEFVASLPTKYKYYKGQKKRILKDILYDYIPKKMLERPKLGFTVPIYNWLKNDLSYLLDDFISKDKLIESNVFNVDYALYLLKLFRKNKLGDETVIWKILVFQMWYFHWNSKFLT